MSSLRKQAVAGGTWTVISNIFSAIAQLIQLAVLARLLLPSDFGLMAMITVVVGFARSFGDAGISKAIIHFQNATKDELSSLYWLNIMAGVIVSAVVWAVAPLFALLFKEPELLQLLHLAAIIFIIVPVGQQFQILLEKNLLFKRMALIEIVARFCGLVIAVFIAYSGYGVYALVWGFLGNAIVKAILLALLGWRSWRPEIIFRFHEIKPFLSFGLFQMGERSLNYFGQQLDKLLIGVLLGSQALGYYSIAYQLMLRPMQVINPVFTRVAFPIFSKIQQDNRRLREGYYEVVRLIILLAMPIYMGMIVLAEPFLTVLIGPGWAPTIPLFQTLCILGFFYSQGNPIGSLLLAKGRADMGFYLNLFMVLLYGSAVWIGSTIGLEAIAWALVIATATVLFPIGIWIRWYLVQMPLVEYISVIAPSLLAAIAMGVGLHLLNTLISWPGTLSQLLVLGLIGAGIYNLLVFKWAKPLLARLWQTVKR